MGVRIRKGQCYVCGKWDCDDICCEEIIANSQMETMDIEDITGERQENFYN